MPRHDVAIPQEILVDTFHFLPREELEQSCQLVSQDWNYTVQTSPLPLRSYECLRLYAQKTARLTFYQPPAPAYQKWEVVNFTRDSIGYDFDDDRVVAKIKTLKYGKFRLVDIQCLDDDFTPRLLKRMMELVGPKMLTCKFQASKIEGGIRILTDKVQFEVYPSDHGFDRLSFVKIPQKVYLRIWDAGWNPLAFVQSQIPHLDRYKIEIFKRRNGLEDLEKLVETYKTAPDPTTLVKKFIFSIPLASVLEERATVFLKNLKTPPVTESYHWYNSDMPMKQHYVIKKIEEYVLKITSVYIDNPSYRLYSIALVVCKN